MTQLTTTQILAQKLGDLLTAKGLQAATAESCTGGGVAHAITAIAGSSTWFELGVVTYSDKMKAQLLKVKETTLSAYGAVSEPVVQEMVAGVLKCAGADIAVAVSGIAGPGGGVPGKPVGTVCFAWGDKVRVEANTVVFEGDRTSVRAQSVDYALQCLVDMAISKNTV